MPREQTRSSFGGLRRMHIGGDGRMMRAKSGGMTRVSAAVWPALVIQVFWAADALAAEAARVVSLPRLHEGGLAGLGAVIAVAGLVAVLRRGR